MKPLAIDLFCGLGGWSEGLLDEGYYVVGFDIEQHIYGAHRYPAQLVIQDVLTLHGSQFKDAALIVASPPCQAYSYRAMPWKRAKALPPPDNSLFEACFWIQREASEAAGHHIPLIVENVRGAQKWVGRSRWNYGSFHLWGDVPALMPMTRFRSKSPKPGTGNQLCAIRPDQFREDGQKTSGLVNIRNGHSHTRHLTNQVEHDQIRNTGGSWFNVAHNTTSGHGRNPDGRKMKDQDGYARNYPNAFGWKSPRTSSKNTPARKAASALIAKIPEPLARHIARTFKPEGTDAP
jgi:C-5 cytosine-specific DNA methylase